ncbi:MAG TPA: hypothetical protein VFP27_07995 [Mycobacterium sp.]|nr:hypothetical protein [Mycobacterium sp.]
MVDPTLTASFAAISVANLTPLTQQTWDPQLARDPRLLVPVDVRAMVVGDGETCEHALAGTSLLSATVPEQRAPQPFSDGDPRPAGVYLHWALPDGLTQGRAAADAGIGLQPLPDRWIVARIESGLPRPVRAWVVEAERGSRTLLEAWPGGAPIAATRTPTMASADLHAAAGGDPAWAALWDNVEDRFAMYDDLADARDRGGTFSYLVAGWYSDAELDPLHLGSSDGTFDELMTRLGWQLDRARLEAVRAEMARRRAAAAAIGLTSLPLIVSSLAGQMDPQPIKAKPDPLPRRAAGPPQGSPVRVPITAVPPRLLEAATAIGIKSAPWCPRQSLYHGAVHGVRLSPAGRADGRPAADSVRVGIGATGTESLAALVAADLPGTDDDQERLQTAFAYGILDRLDDADGIPRLEAELHARAFVSAPGGWREEQILVGDPIAPLSGSAAPTKRQDRLDQQTADVREIADRPVRFEMQRASRVATASAYTLATAPQRINKPADPRRIETVRRALPRWYFPQDPVITVRGLNRSLRHGYDGRFEPTESLACRLSGDAVTALAGLVDGADLMERGIEHGGVPEDVADLLVETVLEDPDPIWTDQLSTHVADSKGLAPQLVSARLHGERRLHLHTQRVGSDTGRLMVGSLRDGVLASPVAFTPFRQAWIPLYLEWRLELALDDRATRWALGELDFEPAEGELAAGANAMTLSGRSLLTSAGAKAFADRITEYLAQEQKLDRSGLGEITDAVANELRGIAGHALYADVLSAATERLREHFLGFDTDTGVAPANDDATPAAPTREPLLLRAGAARLTALRIVDTFGRILQVPDNLLKQMVVSEALQVPDTAGANDEFLLAPRFTAPSRLQVRLLDAANDAAEATIDQGADASASPVAAWLLPDHVDGALEVFDADGQPVGQLRHEDLGGGVVWEGAPGRPEPIGAPPPASLSGHARTFATELVRMDAVERSAGRAPDADSPLSALLRVIDTTLWTVDPFGQTGSEHLSLLIGRPIAVVRAELRLDVRSDVDDYAGLSPAAKAERQAAFAALADRAFDVRLGALTYQDDGLLGYFVDDDYTRIFPVHASVLMQALPSGRHEGYLGPVDEVTAFDASEQTRPISSSYVVPDPTVTVRPGQTVRLTLLMDPGHTVHVSCGLLPRKSIALLRDWTADALARLAPSFRVGPVLVDPQTIRLPEPSAVGAHQQWTRRDGPLTWRDDPIVASTQDALLPDAATEVQEGYVRVRDESTG